MKSCQCFSSKFKRKGSISQCCSSLYILLINVPSYRFSLARLAEMEREKNRAWKFLPLFFFSTIAEGMISMDCLSTLWKESWTQWCSKIRFQGFLHSKNHRNNDRDGVRDIVQYKMCQAWYYFNTRLIRHLTFMRPIAVSEYTF